MPETWKPIPDFPGYDVSDQGRVRSYYKCVRGKWPITDRPQRILKHAINRGGYPYLNLRRERITFTRIVHRLVTRTFLGECPDGLEVCHNDGTPQNNRLSNLRYDTHQANMQEAYKQTYRHNSKPTAPATVGSLL